MLTLLNPLPGQIIGDLGSGNGLTGNSLAIFGCKVKGFEVLPKAVEVAKEFSKKLGLNESEMPDFQAIATGHGLAGQHQKFHRLHGGYMMALSDAKKYVDENLLCEGRAVLNVGNHNEGSVIIFLKDKNGNVTIEDPDLPVIFQADANPTAGR